MLNKLAKIILIILCFLVTGWAIGFVFSYWVLLAVTPPLYFSITYLILCYLVLGLKKIDEGTLLDAIIIVFSFYIACWWGDIFVKIMPKFIPYTLAVNMGSSLLGGGIIQIFLWRKIKHWWKYILIPVNTLFAGWLFDLFWGIKIKGPADMLGLDDPRFFDAFCSWFVIVGSTTVIVKLLAGPQQNAE